VTVRNRETERHPVGFRRLREVTVPNEAIRNLDTSNRRDRAIAESPEVAVLPRYYLNVELAFDTHAGRGRIVGRAEYLLPADQPHRRDPRIRARGRPL